MKSVTQKIEKILEKMQNLFLRLAVKPYLRNIFLRLTYPKLYFEDQIFAISSQNHKNKFRNNL